jgi:hypothetical protein
VLLPHLAAVVIDGIVRVAGVVEVWARPRAGGATCPECGAGPIAGSPVQVCGNRLCACDIRRTGRRADETYGRRSQLLGTMLAAIGLALPGRAGARLADRLELRAFAGEPAGRSEGSAGQAQGRSRVVRAGVDLGDPEAAFLRCGGDQLGCAQVDGGWRRPIHQPGFLPA